MPSSLGSLKSKSDQLDDDKLVSVPFDFSKLIDEVKKYFFQKDVYNAKIKKSLILLT